MQLGMNVKNNKPTNKQSNAAANQQQEFSSFDDLDNAMANGTVNTEMPNKSSLNKTAIIVGGIAAVVIVVILVVLAMAKNGKSADDADTEYTTEETQVDDTQMTETQELDEELQGYLETQPTETPSNGVYDEDGNVISDREDIINPGVSEFNTDGGTTTATVYSPNDFIKDLNGVDISAVYNVKSFSYLFDYVNYEKRRAIMDDGMELYWLDITYHNKKYRCTVPFYIFKSLDSSGITRVKLELLTLDNGEKVISYMRVAEDGEE